MVKHLLSVMSVLLTRLAKAYTLQQEKQHSLSTFALSHNTAVLLKLINLKLWWVQLK